MKGDSVESAGSGIAAMLEPEGNAARTAAVRWRRIQDALSGDESRRETVMVAIAAFRNAQSAYDASYAGGRGDGFDGIRAGTFACLYLRGFDHIRVGLMGGAAPKDAIDRMQSVSDWLERMEWPGLPRHAFVGAQTIPLSRNAAGMHTDMLRYRESYDRIVAAVTAARRAG